METILWGFGTVLPVPYETTLSTVPREEQLLNYQVDSVDHEY